MWLLYFLQNEFKKIFVFFYTPVTFCARCIVQKISKLVCHCHLVCSKCEQLQTLWKVFKNSRKFGDWHNDCRIQMIYLVVWFICRKLAKLPVIRRWLLWPPIWNRLVGSRCVHGEHCEDIWPKFMQCIGHLILEILSLPHRMANW